jgi:hypothetical protein
MLRSILLVALCALFVDVCHAGPSGPTVGVHVYTEHFSNAQLQNVNPGVYWVGANGLTIGAYINSYDRPSEYMGYTWQGERFSLMLGAATGYGGQCRVCKMITPMVVPSVKLGIVRLSIPNAQGIHLSIEKEWQ